MSWIDEARVTLAQHVAEELAERQEIEARLSAIEAAIKSAGIAEYTVAQAENWIDQQYAGATTMVEGFAATKRILKKMLPLLLRTRL